MHSQSRLMMNEQAIIQEFPLPDIRSELREADLRAHGARHRAFEVVVYNREVRACLKNNIDHAYFNERWAECQHAIVHTRNEIGLARRLSEQFPQSQGFVIVDIIERRLPEVI